jgi:hypothetical protein
MLYYRQSDRLYTFAARAYERKLYDVFLLAIDLQANTRSVTLLISQQHECLRNVHSKHIRCNLTYD